MFTQSAMCESLLEELQRITRYASQVNAMLLLVSVWFRLHNTSLNAFLNLTFVSPYKIQFKHELTIPS